MLHQKLERLHIHKKLRQPKQSRAKNYIEINIRQLNVVAATILESLSRRDSRIKCSFFEILKESKMSQHTIWNNLFGILYLFKKINLLSCLKSIMKIFQNLHDELNINFHTKKIFIKNFSSQIH